MRQKLTFIFSLTIFITLTHFDVFARAGGGGGKGGGSILGLFLWGIYTLIISVILFFKVRKSKKIVAIDSQYDSFWNFDQMRNNAKDVFFKMQDAWMARDIDMVKDIITQRLYEDYKTQLQVMKNAGEKNILSDINVTKVRIIGCEDYLDNSHDSYIAHVKGDIIDYTINEQTNEIIKNTEKKSESFADIYHFMRKGDKWLLDHIDNKVSIWDVIRTKNYHEK